MKSLFFAPTFLVLILISGCTSDKSEKASEVKTEAVTQAPLPTSAKLLYPREFREALYFAASLERESLRLITHQNSFEGTTLFSVLSYAFEMNSGKKKMALSGLDCSRFKIETSGSDFNLFKTCVKPFALIATIKSLNQAHDHYQVSFKLKEWSSIVGLSVTLTNSDVQCEFQLKDKKFHSLNCQNWTFAVAANSISATEIKLSTFTFNRDQQNQLSLVGGFYRDLMERKKIEVLVPLQGKIKLIEKEIEVKDDFAEKPKQNEDTHGEKNQNQSEAESKNGEKNGEKSNEKSSQEDYQKWIQGEGQSQSQSESENTVKDEDINQDQNNGGVPKSKGGASSGRHGR
jgi:hypothetical protein